MSISILSQRLLQRVQGYFAGKRQSEFEQSLIRIVIGSLLLIYFVRIGSSLPERATGLHPDLLQTLAIFLCLSLLISLSVLISPGEHPLRRTAAILLDTGTLTYIFLIGGGHAAPLFFLYLWIIIGYGFRFGQRYLFISLAFSLLGFGIAISYVPYWRAERGIAIGLWLGTLLVSLYFSMLVGRLYKALQQAETANAAKRQFICAVSHELRTPLNAIIGMVDLMKSTRIDREQADMLDTMTMTSQLMLSQIEDVLDFSKIEAGKMSLEAVDFNLYQLAQGILSVFRYRIDPTAIVLTSHIDARIPAMLNGDPHHLRQILVNLLGNAVKFTEQGRIRLRIEWLANEDGAVSLRFSVTDTGIGIPASAHARIFDSFTQASESTARRYGGTGLGTTICKQLVELMGGEIGFSSEEGRGSEFWFVISLRHVFTGEPRRPADRTIRTLFVGMGEQGAALAGIVAEHAGIAPTIVSSLAEAKAAIEQSNLDEHPFLLAFIGFPELFQLKPEKAALTMARMVSELNRPAVSRHLPVVLALPEGKHDTELATMAAQAGCFSVLYADDAPICLDRLLYVVTLESGRDIAQHSLAVDPDGLKIGAGKVESSLDPDSYKILVAEDNPTNRKVIQKILERAGHQCFMARDGEEALDLVDKRQFDALILDMNMPGMGGTDAARMYRLMHAGQTRMPIIMFSANATPEARSESLEAGADEFLSKPVQVDLLLQTLNLLVTRYRAGDTLMDDRSHPTQIVGLPSLHTHDRILEPKYLTDLEEVSVEPRFLDDLIVEFMTENRRMIDRLGNAIDDHEWSNVQDILHAIKGSALSIGATSLKNLCRQVEKLSAAEMKLHAPDLMFEIRQAFLQLCQELEQYRQQRKNSRLTH